MSNNIHSAKIEQMVLAAMKLEENQNEDGSINWDFVSSDVYIDLDCNGGKLGGKIERVIDKVARRMEREAHEAEVNAWLAEYPQIGRLNNGTYYVMIDGEQQQVAELCPPIFMDVETGEIVK